MGGGRKRGRSQRRHFKEERENVWKDNPKRPPAGAGGGEGGEGGWQPFATENPAFEDYYKVQPLGSDHHHV
jgi:multisite-specific tRNA:(cytosine-C5)-methyltransferase